MVLRGNLGILIFGQQLVNFKMLVSSIKLVMAFEFEAFAGAVIWDLNDWKKTCDLPPTRLESNATGILLFLRS